jgi:hypothetical protein
VVYVARRVLFHRTPPKVKQEQHPYAPNLCLCNMHNVSAAKKNLPTTTANKSQFGTFFSQGRWPTSRFYLFIHALNESLFLRVLNKTMRALVNIE